jgi:outer membrane protein assembly factor BamB
MSKFLCPFILIFFVCSNSFAQEFSEWRGKGRTGVYDETGLLKEWPVDGPKMIWF